MQNMGATIVWSILSVIFIYAFMVWCLAPAPPNKWQQLINVVKSIQDDVAKK